MTDGCRSSRVVDTICCDHGSNISHATILRFFDIASYIVPSETVSKVIKVKITSF